MSFPRVKRGTRGYNTTEVDAFISQARVAYDNNIAGVVSLTSRSIRETSFDTHKGGYSTRHVDGALERLETAFAERERAVALATIGEGAWLEQSSQISEVLTSRFSRKPKHRFARVGLFTQGYAVTDVDAFTDRVVGFLLRGEEITVADVRSVTFRAARGGYEEAQVDAALDAVVELLLSLGKD